jgi:hypothetical protein
MKYAGRSWVGAARTVVCAHRAAIVVRTRAMMDLPICVMHEFRSVEF